MPDFVGNLSECGFQGQSMWYFTKIAISVAVILIGTSVGAQERIFWDRFDMPNGWTDNHDGYDPVERVLALGITAEDFDQLFDRAVEDAENCLPKKPWLDPLGGLLTVPYNGLKCRSKPQGLMS